MSLSQRLAEYVAAAFTGLWIQSYEHEDALAEISRLCQERKWSLASWDIDRGLQLGASAAPNAPAAASDPLAAIKSVNALSDPDSSALLVLPNFHKFLAGAEVIQALAHQIQLGKTNCTFMVILSSVVQIPVELERQFIVLEHELPSREQLAQIARGVATEPGEMPKDSDLDRLLDAAAGLTRYEAEGAFSLSLARHNRLEPESIWELKTQALKKSGLLTLHRGGESFDDLGGLEALKAFCTKALADSPGGDHTVRPRGILLLGVPGSGKSALAKALGNQTGRPTLVMDVGALLGSLVGQSESNTRQALRIADAMAPCVLFLDEVEKALSGVASSGQTDSGVSARLFGSFLTWLSDHQSDVFVIATCNDISKLPPEFSRAERFDGVFFVDLPTAVERQCIWEMYLKKFGLSQQALPKDDDWTGAEIRACCRLARLLQIPLKEAAGNVVPVAVTAAESVERLRNWAAGRCLSAHQAGIYRRTARSANGPARRVVRAGSEN